MFVVIAYDIVCDRRRQRLAKLLSGYGERVNFSVFECDLKPRQFDRLQQRIAKSINPDEDRVRFYELCLDCLKRVQVQGRTSTLFRDKSLVVV